MSHCRTGRTLLNEVIKSDAPPLVTLVASITRTLNSNVNTQIVTLHIFFYSHLLVFYSYIVLNPEQINVIAVFLLGAACLSLRVSGALGTGYNRPQVELRNIPRKRIDERVAGRDDGIGQKKVKIWVRIVL